MCDKAKKARSANFSKQEELLLLEEVQKEQHIVECKETNKVCIIEKERSWERIRNKFNSKNYQYRTVEQLRSKFDNLKTKARKMMANKRKCCNGTDAGLFLVDDADPILELVLKIISINTVVGTDYNYDSDNVHMNIPSNNARCTSNASTPTIKEDLSDNESFPVIVIEDSQMPTTGINVNDSVFPNKRDQIHCDPSPNSDQEMTFKQNETLDTPKATSSKRKADPDWNSNVPWKLREPVSKELVPTIKEYYSTKIQYLKGEIEGQQQKYTIAKKEEERRHEEHLLKIKILKLEHQKLQRELQLK